MKKTPVLIGSAFMALAVILGAFGAHGLEGKLSADSLDSYNTAVDYQIYHSLALILCGIMGKSSTSPLFKWTWGAFVIGIILFSGSIYLLSTRDVTGMEGISFLGPVTPIGGMLLIIGWVLFFINSLKISQRS